MNSQKKGNASSGEGSSEGSSLFERTITALLVVTVIFLLPLCIGKIVVMANNSGML